MLKITASGAYYTGGGKGGKEIVDFENVVGIIPDIAQERIQQAVMWRMIQIWISKDPRFTKRFDILRVCYIDKVEEVSDTPSVVGKNIKELTWEELQELAVWKNLRKIPNYKTTDLRLARERAYLEYSKLQGNEINENEKGYSYSALPALVVANDAKVAKPAPHISNEEKIAEEQGDKSLGGDKTFSLPELKKIAKKQGIKLPPRVTLEQAFNLVFGGGK